MKLDIRHEDPVTIVAVDGEVDAANSAELGDSLLELLDGGHKKVVVDLENLKFIDSSGLGVLVRVYKRARAGAGDVCLAALQPPVERVFNLTRLDRVFDTHPDVSAAVQQMSRQ